MAEVFQNQLRESTDLLYWDCLLNACAVREYCKFEDSSAFEPDSSAALRRGDLFPIHFFIDPFQNNCMVDYN
ncbi:uncharacterized protein N7473_006300 [Penicillium subrubescens]|uniref:Uncharacterized protein n=1 Tax=Penicillium subrubescens TaxID=1316194 RepID=A0A1Q5UEG9_9EURO|nr:uncharacterized protein N7473_006300 [Penicillium subrubescens]KAJ5896901.1 hypothetical protein N7473_006300 [Penicillium subrubescens]OKP10868.1 hypothetical protein PENSUB_3688 [Penicillium subrubescens]